MKAVQLKNLILESERFKIISDFENKKIAELLSKLDESVCEQVAIDISTKCESRVLSLKTLLDFVKNALFLDAVKKAKKSDISGGEYLSNYEKQRILRVFYFKRALKKLPEWAKKAILGQDNE